MAETGKLVLAVRTGDEVRVGEAVVRLRFDHRKRRTVMIIEAPKGSQIYACGYARRYVKGSRTDPRMCSRGRAAGETVGCAGACGGGEGCRAVAAVRPGV